MGGSAHIMLKLNEIYFGSRKYINFNLKYLYSLYSFNQNIFLNVFQGL